VSPIGIRRATRRLRHHATGLLLVLALAGAITADHSAIGMSDVHHDGMGAAIEMCLGAFTAVGATVVAVALGILALGRWPASPALTPAGALACAGTRAPEARAGPPPRHCSQLCVWRH
jgi:hypothetical protein